MWFSAKGKKAAEAGKTVTQAVLRDLATAAARPCGGVRVRGRRGGAKCSRARAHTGEAEGARVFRAVWALGGAAHPLRALPTPGAVRGGSIGAAAEERLAPF